MSKVLVVDDDAYVRQVVHDYLSADGHDVIDAPDGATGLNLLLSGEVDAAVLDLMLPGIDGLEVFRRARAAGVETPIIVLSAKSGESDRILGLELGADDYLTKPFSPRELVLRVRSILRRANARHQTEQTIVDGDLVVDLSARRVTLSGREISLTLREFDLLAFLVQQPGKVWSRDELMAAVWGWDCGDPSTVTVHVRRLRGKLEVEPSSPTRLVTAWGHGYRWDPQP
ncbi:response regulator transcription factor [Cutibacterium equinum]|uniref:Response regulator transcription factor n=1 Tax=Cutibacterium equinum TaxID=3016342 RepID=A0ABY7QWJ3_9ACTN|nr:response regulator transcription factor [Cutibacterium equinum]WCC79095.1 response regulator transcription factor [Cutibacterium equinum]